MIKMVAIKPIVALGLLAGHISPALSVIVRINALGDSITGSPVCLSISLKSSGCPRANIIDHHRAVGELFSTKNSRLLA